VEILAQSSTAFVLTHNFQGTHILGASHGRLSDSVASCKPYYWSLFFTLYTLILLCVFFNDFLLFIYIILCYNSGIVTCLL